MEAEKKSNDPKGDLGGDSKINEVEGLKQGDRTAQAARTQQQQGRQARNRDINGEDGWHQVTYRKRTQFAGKLHGQAESRRGAVNLADKRAFISREMEEAYKAAFKEGKCFRCLSKDHKRANCREPVRCFKCNRMGHKYGGCKIQQQEIKGQCKPQQYKYPQHHGVSYAGVLKPSEKTPNLIQPNVLKPTVKSKRETPSGKVNMDDLWEVRPEETHVYMPIREGLRPQNMNLWCTGLVVMTQGQPTGDIPGLLAHRLARQFGGTALQNEVYAGNEEDDAPFVLMVQNRARLQEIVWNSPYTLRRGVQVGVVLWEQEWNMVYEPEPYQAWLRLWDLPLHAWNTEDLRKVTTGVGRITAILPHGRRAGHFRHVTIRVACDDPEEISRFLKYHENGHARRVRVQILHWREWQQGPYPLQQNQWPPEQNPEANPQPPIIPHDIPPLSPPEETYTSSTDISSGGSNNSQGPAGGRVERKLENRAKKSKNRVKSLGVRKAPMKKKKKKKKVTRKVTKVWRKKIKQPADMVLSQREVSYVETPKVTERPLYVKRSDFKFEIFDKKAGQLLLQVGLTLLPCVHHHNKVSINCSVLLGEKFGDKKFAGELIGYKAEVYRWLQLIGSQDESCDDKEINELKDDSSHENGIGLDSDEQQRNNNGPDYMGFNTHQGYQRHESQDVLLLGLDGWAEMIRREKEMRREAVNKIPQPVQTDHEEISQVTQGVSEEEMLHPPGFPTPRYKKKNLEPTRRSPRLKQKKNYGKAKRTKGEKMVIDFETRTETISPTLAIEILEESGTTVTQKVKNMLFEAQDEINKGQEEEFQALMSATINE